MAFNGDAISTSIICQMYPPTCAPPPSPPTSNLRVFRLVEDLSPDVHHMWRTYIQLSST